MTGAQRTPLIKRSLLSLVPTPLLPAHPPSHGSHVQWRIPRDRWHLRCLRGRSPRSLWVDFEELPCRCSKAGILGSRELYTNPTCHLACYPTCREAERSRPPSPSLPHFPVDHNTDDLVIEVTKNLLLNCSRIFQTSCRPPWVRVFASHLDRQKWCEPGPST